MLIPGPGDEPLPGDTAVGIGGGVTVEIVKYKSGAAALEPAEFDAETLHAYVPFARFDTVAEGEVTGCPYTCALVAAFTTTTVYEVAPCTTFHVSVTAELVRVGPGEDVLPGDSPVGTCGTAGPVLTVK